MIFLRKGLKNLFNLKKLEFDLLTNYLGGEEDNINIYNLKHGLKYLFNLSYLKLDISWNNLG